MNVSNVSYEQNHIYRNYIILMMITAISSLDFMIYLFAYYTVT